MSTTAASPFKVEYARSDRSTCKSCRSKIDKETFRFAIYVRSSKFDGQVPHWFHTDCFFQKVKLIDLKLIKGFDELRWNDQQKIRQLVEENATKPSNGVVPTDAFSVQYAPSSRSSCRVCSQKIEKNLLRISRKNYVSIRARKFGPTDEWFHVDCFAEQKNDLGFFGRAESFVGFHQLTTNDRKTFETKFNVKRKRKRNDDDEIQSKKKQNELLWKFKDALKNDVSHDVMKKLLEKNGQKIVSGEANLIESLADCLAFGALENCPECGGSLVFNFTNYRCTGNLTEWTKCSFSTVLPERKPFEIPDEFQDESEIFENFEFTKRDRILTETKSKNDENDSKFDEKQPLKGFSIFVTGRLTKSSNFVEKKLKKLGATCPQRLGKTTDLLISSKKTMGKRTYNIRKAEQFDIPIVSEEFLDEIVADRTTAIEKTKISSWGSSKKVRKEKKRRQTTKIVDRSSKMTMKFKGGAPIDPSSGLEETCHVVKDRTTGTIYSAVLGMVDVTRGTNSFYKIQLGRIGTTFGSQHLSKFDDQIEAIKAFEKIFLNKTGNDWNDREHFQKQPNKLYPLDIDFGDDEQMEKFFNESKTKTSSRLSLSVQNLIEMIFNVENMGKTLLEFEIDTTKMPLGKLSRNQLKKSLEILTELQTLIENGSTRKHLFIDASNRFYTLIPHDFGRSKPVILDQIDLIKLKTEMIENLLEIEIAYSLLKSSMNDETENPLDVHYGKLKCSIEPVDRTSEEFEQIENYLKTTHAATHHQYALKLKELFKVQRENEDERFAKWKNLSNQQLLWHGSRTTNFAGILSQGLRIAPPEAPMTGYMFGKGVYFADMASKSANYCFTNRDSPEGLMLLCQVALGQMHECTVAKSFSADTLPFGTHSIKGCGQTIPDPKEHFFIDEHLLVPMGKGINANLPYSALLYNEFIVYNSDQIQIRYLLRLDFDFK